VAEGFSFRRVELGRPQDLLDRHIPVQGLVTGKPDNTHPAAADDSLKPVPPGEKVPRLSRTHPSPLPGLNTS